MGLLGVGALALISHLLPVKPLMHVQRYASGRTARCVVESEHRAPCLHGLLAHSLTSISQLPDSVEDAVLSFTVHACWYCLT
eukprot:COSAG01_NODE_62966_length_282_cov_0.666667_1_plen_81_part_01